MLEREKKRLLFILFFLTVLNFNVSFVCAQGLSSKISASILENPINKLAQKIGEIEGLVETKKKEFQERKTEDAVNFIIFLAVSSSLVVWPVLSDVKERYEKKIKREVRKGKPAKKRKKKR